MLPGGNNGFQIKTDLLPPVDKYAGTFEFIQHLQWYHLLFEGCQQPVPELRHFFPVFVPVVGALKPGKIVLCLLPPIRQDPGVGGKGLNNGLI